MEWLVLKETSVGLVPLLERKKLKRKIKQEKGMEQNQNVLPSAVKEFDVTTEELPTQ